MPNHVYYHLAMNDLTPKQVEKLQTIADTDNGICGYYYPMPEELRNTTSPTRIVSESEYEQIMKENEKIDRTQPWYYEPKPITEKMQQALLAKYGVDNWYDWAHFIWGTKWGCYDNDIDGQTLTFATAWSLFNTSILDKFAQDFPDFILSYQEEQGWGGEFVYENGICIEHHEYDAPEWSGIVFESEEGQICKLKTDIADTHSGEGASAGYYYDYDTSCPVPEDVLKELKLN